MEEQRVRPADLARDGSPGAHAQCNNDWTKHARLAAMGATFEQSNEVTVLSAS